MINTDQDILDACQNYSAKKVYDAAFAFMRNDKSALLAVGLKNPTGIGEADYISGMVFKMLSQVNKAKDLTDITIDLAKQQSAAQK